MQVRILAFDPGTANTGYSVIEGYIEGARTQKPRLTSDWGVLSTAKEDGDVRARIDTIGQDMQQLILRLQPTHIAIEDFTEQGKLVGKTYKEMSWLIEHMRVTSKAQNVLPAIFENGYWKKQTLGISRASKSQVQHFLLRNVDGTQVLQNLPKSKNHIWDSVGVGYCLYTLLTQGDFSI